MSPAAFAPLREVGAFGADGGVITVARVDRRLVGQPLEQGLEPSMMRAWFSLLPKVFPGPPGNRQAAGYNGVSDRLAS